jgi:hypothetical protein
MQRNRFAPFMTISCLVLALAACGHEQQPAQQDADAALPMPEADTGAVTGMPDTPGPGAIGAPMPPPAPSTVASTDAAGPTTPPDASQGVAVGERNPAAGNAAEPGPGDATRLLRDYYAAIVARDYGAAWRLWSDDGAASHQTLQQFANGFADTTGIGVEIGTPGDEDAGAGQRYIEVPVTVTATHADGSMHRYAGSYVLHRTVVDGASAAQRAWRIDSAKLREVAP